FGGAALDLGESVLALVNACGEDPGPGAAARGGECRVTPEVRKGNSWTLVAGALGAMREDLDELSTMLSAQLPMLLPDLAVRHASLEREVQGALASISEIAMLAAELRDNPRPGQCYEATTRVLSRGGSRSTVS